MQTLGAFRIHAGSGYVGTGNFYPTGTLEYPNLALVISPSNCQNTEGRYRKKKLRYSYSGFHLPLFDTTIGNEETKPDTGRWWNSPAVLTAIPRRICPASHGG